MIETITPPKHTNETPVDTPTTGQIDDNDRTTVSVDQILKRLGKSGLIEDGEGAARRTYVVGGREITFLNPQEISSLPDRSVYYVAADTVTPIMPLEGDGDPGQIDDLKRRGAYRCEKSIDNGGDLIAIPATPLGIVEVAIHLGADGMDEVHEALLQKEYTNPKALSFIDSFVAAISMKEDGNFASEFAIGDGSALLTAALCGDNEAKEVVLERLNALHLQEENRIKNRGGLYETGEHTTADKVCLVRSTPYPPEFDKDGNVILYPAGHYNNGVYPRSTIHFTCNSLVATSHSLGNEWDPDNTVLIANFKDTLELNGYVNDGVITTFETLSGVDSWASLKPGESMKFPAIVIESVVDGQEEPIVREGDRVKILQKDGDYSPEQMASIIEALPVFQGYPNVSFERLREEYIKQIMIESGVDKSMTDTPSADGHGMASFDIENEIRNLAGSLGLRSDKHFESPEDSDEKAGYRALRFYEGYLYMENTWIYPETPLNALRYRAVVGAFSSFSQADLRELEDRKYDAEEIR